jgi:hypothetical protein
VAATLAHPHTFDRIHVAQIIDLLAWDDVLASARTALERLATSHCGMLIDALLEPSTDFAIRRRLPRILATCPTPRALDGVVRGLDDSRFEVRYHCSRAIDRLDRLILHGIAGAVILPAAPWAMIRDYMLRHHASPVGR